MKKVTIIIPFYNSEKYADSILKSVLLQTYDNIQLILVDDGSTDDTLNIILGYRKRFEERGYICTYLSKPNGGPSSAVNYALKYVEGEYLMWADSDDILYPRNVEAKASYLDEHPNDNLVVCQASGVEDGGEHRIFDLHNYPNEDGNIFDNLIDSKIGCYPGTFMIRTDELWKIYPDKEMYHHKYIGQNWPLLLPVAYNSSCGCIKEKLYEYHIKERSHSRGLEIRNKIEYLMAEIDALKNILAFTSEREKITRRREEHNYKKILKLAFLCREKNVYKECFEKLTKVSKISESENLMNELLCNERKFILYGYGKLGKIIYGEYSKQIEYVVENYNKSEETVVYKEFKEISEPLNDYVWVIAVGNDYSEIEMEIKSDYPYSRTLVMHL